MKIQALGTDLHPRTVLTDRRASQRFSGTPIAEC